MREDVRALLTDVEGEVRVRDLEQAVIGLFNFPLKL